MSAPKVLGVQEIADRLGVGRGRVEQLAREPGFPEPTRLALGRVWSAEDVEAWIREHRPELAGKPES